MTIKIDNYSDGSREIIDESGIGLQITTASGTRFDIEVREESPDFLRVRLVEASMGMAIAVIPEVTNSVILRAIEPR